MEQETNSDSRPALKESIDGKEGTTIANFQAFPSQNVSAPPGPTFSQPHFEQPKFMGQGDIRRNHRPYFMSQNKTEVKYQDHVHPVNPRFGPMPHIPFYPDPYGYSFYPEPNRMHAQLIRSNDYHSQPFMPYPSTGFFSPLQHEVRTHGPAYIGRTVNTIQQHDRPPVISWENYPPTISYRDISLQQNRGVVMPFVGPPRFPPSGIVKGAPRGVFDYPVPYPGPLPPYPPNAASNTINRPPMPLNNSSNPTNGDIMPTAPPDAIKLQLLRQIEYYFCDENLSHDNYLKSLMDKEGWVPISDIAEFNRVRRLNVGIPVILDALKFSMTIEIQGGKIRRLGEWPRWIQTPKTSKSSPQVEDGSTELTKSESALDSLLPDSLGRSSGIVAEHVTLESQWIKEDASFQNNPPRTKLNLSQNDAVLGESYPVKQSIISENSEYSMCEATPQHAHDDLGTIKDNLLEFGDSSINIRLDNEITFKDQAIDRLAGNLGSFTMNLDDEGCKDDLIPEHPRGNNSPF